MQRRPAPDEAGQPRHCLTEAWAELGLRRRLAGIYSPPDGESPNPQETPQESSRLATLGLRLSDWFERWFPDAFALALAAAAIVATASVLAGSSRSGHGAAVRRRVLGPRHLHDADVDDRRHRLRGGDGAAGLRGDPRAGRRSRRPGRAPPPSSACSRCWRRSLSWSFSLIFSGLLAREVAHRVKGADYRAIGAAAYLGVGSVWALGLSSSAALIMAVAGVAARLRSRRSAASSRSARRSASGRACVIAAALIVVSMAIVLLLGAAGRRRPRAWPRWASPTSRCRTTPARAQTPGEWLEYSPLLTIVDLRARASATWRARSPPTAPAHPARAEPLRLHVPDRRPAAALAAAIVRAGDRRRDHAGGRRADPVSDLRRHREDA